MSSVKPQFIIAIEFYDDSWNLHETKYWRKGDTITNQPLEAAVFDSESAAESALKDEVGAWPGHPVICPLLTPAYPAQ